MLYKFGDLLCSNKQQKLLHICPILMLYFFFCQSTTSKNVHTLLSDA